MGVEVRSYACEGCGAPLPSAADGAHVTCPYCKHKSVIDGNAEALREKSTRVEAEKLFATLGSPPSLSQRIALALTSGVAWVVMPLLLMVFMRLVWYPQQWVAATYEHFAHVRIVHVMKPWQSYVWQIGVPALVLVGVLVWSLFGERLDARRELQAGLAAKPPKTEGGPSVCRNCDASLVVPEGALGVRCAYCGADNLVKLPPEFLAKAKSIGRTLRIDMHIARKRAAEGRRRVRKAILWRAPLVLGLLWLASPSRASFKRASWKDFQLQPEDMGVYQHIVRVEHSDPRVELKMYAACNNARARRQFARDHLIVGDSQCDMDRCNSVGLVALAKGQKIRLDGTGTASIALGNPVYTGGSGVLYDWISDVLVEGTVPLEAEVKISGYYKVDARGSRGDDIELCVIR